MTALVVTGLAAALFLGAGIGLAGPDNGPNSPATGSRVEPGALQRVGSASLEQSVAALQQHLRAQPRDARGWATLGLAYVELARVSGDPSYYPKAEGVLATSLRTQPGDNDAALTGLAALAAARHDFSTALRQADAALAVNPYNPNALAARTDALTELGRYAAAFTAARRADSVHPGLPTFARLSYAYELRGDLDRARALLDRALAGATAPSDVAFTRFHLGELARATGQLETADRHYAAALRADPSYLTALAGRARIAAAQGRTARAIADYERVVAQQPLPQYLTEYGELLEALGRRDSAEEQYAVVRAAAALARENGVGTDLEIALFEADHGDAAAALRAARAEWARRHSVHVADALGWALHANGRDAEALHYARAATRLGTRDARFLFHRGMVESRLGLDGAAERHLRDAVAAGLRASPLRFAQARDALRALDRSP